MGSSSIALSTRIRNARSFIACVVLFAAGTVFALTHVLRDAIAQLVRLWEHLF